MTRPVDFFDTLAFKPDPFQIEAGEIIHSGESVVVTAPTGAGKTVVAEVAVHQALARQRRAFYTTPLKALSNQKFADFREVYGRDAVGLLTGDNSINGQAPIVVMTTEVLRNMIYADSRALDDLGAVVLDEVHYLQDPFRGMVWEEIIIHLPLDIQVVCLSATISNPEEFTDWVHSRRGSTRLVIERDRPVPLESLYLVKDRNRPDPLLLLPLFGRGSKAARPNEQLARLFAHRRRRYGRFRAARRGEVAEMLLDKGLLPAIYFIFSRAGCDAAVEQVADAGLRLTDDAEAAEIRSYAEARTAHLSDGDLAVLGYGRWVSMLEAGIGAHHAGKVPAMKETLEELFNAGLVKLVFATETLSLGINMPARSVVLESLSKFTGESHELLPPGDYTQLTGRAGRRGIDEQGTAVVLYSRFVPLDRVAAIAAAGSHPLESGFRPTYNMAVNLVANYPRERAEELLSASFGQFRRVRERSTLEAEIEQTEREVTELRAAATCDLGDIWAFLDGNGERKGRSHGSVMRAFARELAAGDVLEVGVQQDRRVMLARGVGSNPRLLLLSTAGKLQRMKPEELSPDTARVGSIELPDPFQPRDRGYRRRVAARLRAWEPGGVAALAAYSGDGVEDRSPVAACPDLDDHRRRARQARRAERELVRHRARLRRLGPGLLRRFEATLALLETRGYLEGWRLTEPGERLRYIYNELDLVLAEAARSDLFADLEPADLAAFVSAFVYEPRRGVDTGRWPTQRLKERSNRLDELSQLIAQAEAEHQLPATRPPEYGFMDRAYRWASGVELDELMAGDDTAAGDFVRTARQLIDLLRQLRDAFPHLAEPAGEAIRAVDRGVVTAGGVE